MALAGLVAVLFGLLSGCATGSGRDHASRPAWELPPPRVSEAPVVRPGSLHRDRLANGMEVLILEDHRLPLVGLGISFRRGEGALAPEDAGLASFTAELLERGAGERDAIEFAEYVDEIGASFSGSAGWDSITVGVSGLSRDLDRLFEVLADGTLRPRFDPAEAERARSERQAALERAKDDPATLAGWYGSRALYAGHRYGVPLSGDEESLARLDAERARSFHERTFIPNDAIFFASGDVEAADILARVRAEFGDWSRGEVTPPGPPPPARTPEQRKVLIVDRPDLGQARIVVAHEGLARSDEERLPTNLMNLVVGGSGFSSRLMTTLRSEEGLTYGVYSGYRLRRQPGPFVVSTFTRVPEVRRTLDLLLAELERGVREPPGEDELSWARTLATGRFSMGLETSAAVMAGLVDLEIHDLPRDSLDTYRSRVRALTEADTAQAAQRHLHPERVAIVLVGPAEALVPQVEDLGPVEVVVP